MVVPNLLRGANFKRLLTPELISRKAITLFRWIRLELQMESMLMVIYVDNMAHMYMKRRNKLVSITYALPWNIQYEHKEKCDCVERHISCALI